MDQEPLTEPPDEPEGDDQKAAVGPITPIELLLTDEDYEVMADDDEG